MTTDLTHRWTDSYRIRLAFGYMLVVALFAGAWAWSLFGPLNDAIIEQQSDNLQAVAQAGALVLSQPDASASKTAEQLTADTNLRMTIVASDGTVLADSVEDPAKMENHANRLEIEAALAGEMGTDRRVSATQGIERLYIAVPASFEEELIAVRVSDSLERINEVAASSRRLGLILLAAALMIAAGVIARLTAVASEPIERLSDAATAMALGNLSTTVPTESGELAHMSSALTNLREQMKRRLEDLKTEQLSLRTVLDGMIDVVFLLHDDNIHFANHSAGDLFRQPIRGWKNIHLDDAGLPEAIADTVRTGLKTNELVSTDCGPDTSGCYLHINVLPLNPTETYSRTLVVISDVTERTRVDRVRRDFVANASHELKTPTSGIHLLAESAVRAAADGDSEQAIEFARQIASESARLARLVQDLLDLSRLESTQTTDSLTDIREAITNAMIGHRTAAKSDGLEFIFDDSALRGRDVLAAVDPTDMAVALDNLFDNALKYTEKGSVIVSASIDEDIVRISVTDTGIGIPAEDLPRIFERFYRVDRARSRDSGGTGLGLSLVRHVVERSNGSVEVSSAPKKGSTFTIVLKRGGDPDRSYPTSR